jgi:hypothetical protein
VHASLPLGFHSQGSRHASGEPEKLYYVVIHNSVFSGSPLVSDAVGGCSLLFGSARRIRCIIVLAKIVLSTSADNKFTWAVETAKGAVCCLRQKSTDGITGSCREEYWESVPKSDDLICHSQCSWLVSFDDEMRSRAVARFDGFHEKSGQVP